MANAIRTDTWIRPYENIADWLRLEMKIARWGGPPCSGAGVPARQPI
jgi:hypothetical protein